MIEGMLNRVHHSDCLEGLRRLPDESIDVIVTSPPYWKGFEYEAYFNSYKQYLTDREEILSGRGKRILLQAILRDVLVLFLELLVSRIQVTMVVLCFTMLR